MRKHAFSFSRSGKLRFLLALVLIPLLVVIGVKFKSSLRQAKKEMRAIFVSEEKLSLDSLEPLGKEKKDTRVNKSLTDFTVPEKEMGSLRKSFFSPYLIFESGIDGEYAASRLGTASLNIICAKIPKIGSFSEELLLHLANPELRLNGVWPASSTVVFSKFETTFSRVYDEALVWYVAGRILAEQGRGDDAFRVFSGIIDLALSYENCRLSHPDKQRRFQSCMIREVAAVGLLETSAQLFSTKEQLVYALAELKRQDNSFIPISQILAFEKLIPIEFAQQLGKEVASGKALAKYENEMTKLAEIFSDKAELSSILDQIYDPLIVAFTKPYSIAQRAFNPWNLKHGEIFSISTDSTIGPFKMVLFPNAFLRQSLLEGFTKDLPFHLLLDVKTRQLFQGAQAALAINVFKNETGAYPDSLAKLEQWLEQPLPKDLIRNIPLQFKPGNPPFLASVGRDGKANTLDDLIFSPFGKKAEE